MGVHLIVAFEFTNYHIQNGLKQILSHSLKSQKIDTMCVNCR